MRKAFVQSQCLAVVLLLMFSPHVFGGTPLETIETKVNAVLDVLTDPALKGDTAKEAKEKEKKYI